jgi:arabinogalactan oligomer/maltooligosaccharide transport system substrate-binding protein
MTVNTKNLFRIGAILSVATLALAGCSPAESEKDSDTAAASSLTVWVDAERVAALADAAAEYGEKTGVNVKLVSKDVATVKNDFIQQVPTGEGPDITMGAHDWLGELVTNGVVSPVELGDSTGDYLEVAINAATYDGQTYMLPYAVENLALLRNADLVPNAPATFDEMIAAGTAAGVQYPFIVEQGADGNPYHLYPYQMSYSAPVFGTDSEGSYDAADLQIGNAGGEAFATWLGSQGKNGTGVFNTEITGDIAKEAFTTGQAAFWLTGPWNVGAAKDAGINLAVDVVAPESAAPAQPFAGVKGFFVSEQSKNKVAANDFLVNFIGTEAVQTALFEAGNILPALSASAEAASADPIIAGFAAVGADSVPMPAIPEMGAVFEPWGIAQAAVINGADPIATWQKLAADIQAAIDK